MDETELVRRVFNVQKLSACKNDWVKTVQEHLEVCNFNKSEDEIKNMKKYAFKKMVNERIKELSQVYLLNLKKEHSKYKKICPSNNIKEYLTINQLSTDEKQFLFSMKW